MVKYENTGLSKMTVKIYFIKLFGLDTPIKTKLVAKMPDAFSYCEQFYRRVDSASIVQRAEQTRRLKARKLSGVEEKLERI
jgi:hypothetical protein